METALLLGPRARGFDDAVAEVVLTAGSGIEGRRFLVVEDNPINQQIAVAFLSAAGAAALAVDDGETALARLAAEGTEAFAATLMDIELPGIDGVEAARRIRAQSGAPVVIVAMTGHAAETERLAEHAGAFDAHLSKPFDREKLCAVLAHALAQAQRRAADKPAVAAAAERPAAAGEPQTPPREVAAAVVVDEPRIAGGLDLARLTTIDVSGLIAILGDAGFVSRLLLQLRDNEVGLADDIERAMSDGRMNEAARLAHRIKGVAGNLRAGAVYAAASELELLLLAASPPSPAALRDRAKALRRALTALASDIDGARSGGKRLTHGVVRGVSDATLLRKLRRLVVLLRDQDLAADDLWESTSCAVYARDEGVAGALDAAVGALNYPKASALAAAFATRLRPGAPS